MSLRAIVRDAGLSFAVAWIFLAASAAKMSAAPLDVSEIAPGVFVHQGVVSLYSPRVGGDIANCGFVIGNAAVAVIDTGGSAAIGMALREAIRARTDKPIRYVINTHMHPDHVFGNAAFAPDQPQFVGHKKLARGLVQRAERYIAVNRELMGEAAFEGTRIVPPTLAVDGSEEIDLGGRTLLLEAEPTAHTDNDLTILDKQTNTLFMGDLLFAVHTPAVDGSIRGWIALVEKLRSRQIARVVPGHGPASMPWPDAQKPMLHYLSTVADDVRAAIKAGKTLQQAAASVGLSAKDDWQLFEDFHARNVSAAYAELEWE